MAQVVIEDPILNSAFAEPARHFKFGDDGITDEIVDARRPSSYFVPIPATKKRGGNQQAFETEWTADRVEENAFINRVRERIDRWRSGAYQHVTPTTRRLLECVPSTHRANPAEPPDGRVGPQPRMDPGPKEEPSRLTGVAAPPSCDDDGRC